MKNIQYIQTYKNLIKNIVPSKILNSVAIAISCIETNYGELFIENAKSLFAIPATSPGLVYDKSSNTTKTVETIEPDNHYVVFNSLEESIKAWVNILTTTKTKKGNIKYSNIFNVNDYRKVSNLLQQNGYPLNGPDIINTIISNKLFNEDITNAANTNALAYFVRKSWSDDTNQILVTASKDEAIASAKTNANNGYKVYDKYGEMIYDPSANSISPQISVNSDAKIYSVKANINSSPVYINTNLEKCKQYAIKAGSYRIYDNSNNVIYDPRKDEKSLSAPGLHTPIMLVRGNKVTLENAELFINAVSTKVLNRISGEFKIHDEVCTNNRVKIDTCNGRPMGWVSKFDLR